MFSLSNAPRIYVILAAALALFYLPDNGLCEIHSYTDEDGVRHFVEVPQENASPGNSQEPRNKDSALSRQEAIPDSDEMDAAIQSLSETMMQDPKIMNMIQNLLQNADFQKALQNQDLMDAVQNRDLGALLSDPDFMQLLSSPEIHKIKEKVIENKGE